MDQEFLAQMRAAEERVFRMAETDPELARLKPDPEIVKTVQNPDFSYQQIVAILLRHYADRAALGSRAYTLITDPETGARSRDVLPHYATITYGELGRQIEAIANFWRHDPRHRVEPGEAVAFIAFNGAEMTAVDLACVYANAITVPLQANYPARDMTRILADTAPAALVCSVENLALAVTHALRQPSVRSVFVIAADLRVDAEARAIGDAKNQLAEAGERVALTHFAEAVESGSRFTFEPLPAPAGGRARMVLIMYTSGSTGTPKGAMIHEGICVSAFTSPRSAAPSVAFIFAPMNHSLGRYALYAALGQGGTAYFTQRSDLSTMLEDMRLARPTSMVMIPRICELAQQHYLSEVAKQVANGAGREAAEEQVKAAMRQNFLGDRMTSASVGSAPTTPELRAFMTEIFGIPVSNGYGNTESGGGGLTINNYLSRAVTEFKLIDVPELGYYTTDKPYPRGEFLVKTRNMIQGYYKQPEATAAIFDADGFMKTGDVMEQRGTDQLVWIDRRNNVIKLSQGEYVAIGALETAFLGHGRLVDQMYLYGNSQRGFLLAVVVPSLDAARAALGHEPTDEDLRRLVLQELRETAAKAELKAFEVPRDVLIEREPFTLANGLLSAVGKPLRANLRLRYDERLDAIYREMDRKLEAERKLLRNDATGKSTLLRVTDAIRLNLGLVELDPGSADNYTRLGGDSLGAVNMGLLLEEVFGVALPVTSILHPAASPARLAAQIDALLAGEKQSDRYAEIHADPEMAYAADFSAAALFGDLAQSGGLAPAPAAAAVRCVLLTGANGFLGRFLCLEWLERMARVDGKVICLLRGASAEDARQRLFDAIGTADAALTECFRSLAERHLEVIPADLAAPRFAVDDATFAGLASEVDQIVHVAALVNHRLAYRNLFEPNVLGTTELVRLALTGRLKRFDYVSTIAVTHLSAAIAAAQEAADVRDTVPEVPVGKDRYAMGYSASKWAGEVLLREAHDLTGLPVNVFRADMILPHSRYRGQINLPDSFTRLLASIAMTGLAPVSFYQLDDSGQVQRAHYDGLPVDFVAAAMQQISAAAQNGFHSYNVTNPHDDNISLDRFTDWMIGAGHDVLRVAGHPKWLHRFRERLENLPEEKRQASCLAILGRFASPTPVSGHAVASADFAQAVRGLPAGPEIPHLSQGYILKCIRDMELAGLVAAPAFGKAPVLAEFPVTA